jgi:hypothetical protein
LTSVSFICRMETISPTTQEIQQVSDEINQVLSGG